MAITTEKGREAVQLGDQLERAFHGGSWHGPSVLQALRGVDAEMAGRRPLADAHTIWEITVHLGTWMEVATERILGPASAKPSAVNDWAAIPDESEEAWRETVSALEETQRKLQAVVRELEDLRLDDPVAGSDPTIRGLLFGVLQHNVYHAGQIVLLKKAGMSGDSRS